jgi:hypothetical protein
MLCFLLTAPLIGTSTFLTSYAYLKPNEFKERFTQSDLITVWTTINAIAISLYLIVGFRSGFNRHGLWMSIPCVLLGAYIVGYSYSKLGRTRTFFGAELGLVEDAELINEFPFNLGHAQYKGVIVLLLGVWFAFIHTAELASITGLWVLAYLVQVLVESIPSKGSVTA